MRAMRGMPQARVCFVLVATGVIFPRMTVGNVTKAKQLFLEKLPSTGTSVVWVWLDYYQTPYSQSNTSGLEVIKLFSSSAQLSMKFKLLRNVEIVKNCGQFRFKTQKLVIYPAHKC